MRITQKAIIYTVSITAYLFLIIYNTLRKSDWAIDNLLSLSFLLIIYSLNSHIGLQRTALILLNIPLIFHNLGTFDWYSWNIWFFEYDNAVHFSGAVSAAFILTHLFSRDVLPHQPKVKSSHQTASLVFFLVVSSVIALGAMVELIEYAGSMYLGEGDGILFQGTGDSGKFGGSQYEDTMNDIFVNTLGSFAGVLVYSVRRRIVGIKKRKSN